MRRVLISAGVLLLLAGAAKAQEALEERPVRWTLEADSAAVAASREWSVRLVASVDRGWYLYSPLQPPGGPIALSIELAQPSEFELAGDIAIPRPRRYADRNFNIFSQIYERRAEFGLRVRLAAGEGASGGELVVLPSYQVCTDRYCLPPRTDTVRLALGAIAVSPPSPPEAGRPPRASPEGEAAPTPDPVVAPASAPAPAAPVVERDTIPVTVAAEADGQLLFGAASFGVTDTLARFLWLAVLMGLLSLLTPCVFPMVPITVGFFTRGTAAPGGGGVRGEGLVRASAYALGIVATFSALGFGVALAFGAGGVVRLAANPWLNLVVAVMFVAFALNLLGVYEIRLPRALVARATTAGGADRGVGPAFLMGGAFTLTSFTCTAPFVGTLLVLATQGSWQWPLFGLTVYASAFALPFFLLALMPDALARLPRSGAWMHTLKATLGVVELAAAVKFLSNADLVWHWGVLTREVVVAIWLVAALALVTLFAVHAMRSSRATLPGRFAGARLRASLAPAALGIAALWLAAYLAQGLRGARLGELEAFLPPAREALLIAGGELPWLVNDYDGSLALARAAGRPVLLDFTGYTCTNCRWMEANMFPRPEVRARLDGYVRVRLYTDGQGEPYARQQALQQQRFGTVALPYYAVVAPSGRAVAAFLGMTRDAREFTRFLDEASAAANTDSTPASVDPASSPTPSSTP
jgi:thiol:disulfide interchange protein